MIKVSVIVPVYNVEDYLKECLDSIINQTLRDIEIICIDDCSTDSSYSILEEYTKKDNRVKIFKNSQNESVGYNRNLGIKEAKGEYISFIDSDDYISKDFLYNLYNTAKKYDSDIVNTLNIYRYVDNKKYYRIISFKSKKEYISHCNLKNISLFGENECITPYIWNKLYRRSFLENINLKFITTKLGAAEDANFIIKLMLNKPSISFNNRSIYYYRYTPLSLTNIVNENIDSLRNCIFNMYDVISYCKNNFPDLLDKIYHKAWCPALDFYSGSSDDIKRDSYKDIFDFANFIRIKESMIDNKFDYEINAYNEYLLIIQSDRYNEYVFNRITLKKMLDIKKQLDNLNNKFRFFGINVTDYYFIIVFLGIKISIRRIK